MRIIGTTLRLSCLILSLALACGCASGSKKKLTEVGKVFSPKWHENIKGGMVRTEDARILAAQDPDYKPEPFMEYNSGPYGPQPPR